MASPTPAPPSSQRMLLLYIIILGFDFLIGRYQGNFTPLIWLMSAFAYAIIGFTEWKRTNDLKSATIIAAIGYLWPLIALFTRFAPNNIELSMIIGFFLYPAHPYILINIQDKPWLSLIWFTFLLTLTYSWYMPQVQQIAEMRGIKVNVPSIMDVIKFYYQRIIEFVQYIWKIMKVMYDAQMRNYYIAIGDERGFVQGEEEQAKQELGVSISEMKLLTQPRTGEIAIATATITASTIDLPLRTIITCYALRDEGAIELSNQEIIAEQGTEEETIECTIPEVTTDIKGIQVNASYEFTTHVELVNDFVEKTFGKQLEKGRTLSQLGITNTNPTAQFTLGPVGIGIRTKTQQPIMIDTAQPEIRMPMDITIENKGAGLFKGTVSSLNNIYLILSKPFELTRFHTILDINQASGIRKISCAELSNNEGKNVCEDNTANAYDATRETLTKYAGDYEKGFFTMSAQLTAPTDTVLKQGPVTPHKFEAFVKYSYTTSATTTINIRT
ncbi:hypothetical protein HY486_02880 [Candidatus Woesearchaeota archaeon]|nr:hypothetical protein [Candidatus Woesearchaeota archaeon]